MIADFWSPIKLSIEISFVAGIVAAISGLFLAKAMANKTFKGKALIETGFLLPLVLPPSVIGFLLIIIFGRNSPIGKLIEWLFKQPVIFTWWAAVIATIMAFPLMYHMLIIVQQMKTT